MNAPESAAEARARVDAGRAEARARRDAVLRDRFGDTLPGRWISLLSLGSTAVLALGTAAAVADPDAFITPFFVVTIAWFVIGCVVFMAAIVIAAGRSRECDIGIGGLFFLSGSAPPSVQRPLLGSLIAQVVIAVAGAAAHPFTPLAFGTLAPTLGLALCGLWGAMYGSFPPRTGGDPV